MTRHKNNLPPSPCGGGDGGGVTRRYPTIATHTKTLTLLALLALTLPAAGKTCGTVVYKGKKTNIPCSVAIPNGKRPPPPKPTSNIVPPIQLPGDHPPSRLHPPLRWQQDAVTRR